MSPWSVQRRRRRNLSRVAVALAMAAALVGVIGSAQATPDSEDAEAVANAIESFADRLGQASDALGEYQDLADSLPLTDLSPGEPGGLNLSDLLDDAIGTLGTYASMADLAAFVETRDGTYGGVTVQFGAGAFSQPVVSATATSITVPVHATRTVSEPLDFEFGSTSMDGGSLAVDFVLDTTLSLTVDPSQITDADTAPGTAVSLAPPTINLCANATGSVGVFTARFGFTDVKVSTDDPSTSATTENATLHACAAVAFTDPDSTGGITIDEWTSHALTELASAQIVDAPGTDLAATFYADASLIDGDAFTDVEAADASIAFSDADLSNGFNATPSPTLGPLGDWDNISAGDVANGLAQFVASLAGSQSEGDGPLPFLKSKLSDTFQAVKPLTDYAALLSNAEVGCGTVPGDADSFPTGLTDNLAATTPVYCRARAQSREANSVGWTVPSGTPATAGANTSGAGADATLGADPTADAIFTMTAPGNFTVEVAWDADTTGATDARKAIPRPGTAQELFARLANAAGLDTGGGNLNYSSATKSLTLRLQKNDLNPAPVGMNVSFGDLLRDETNLGGLQDVLEGSASTSFTADVSDVDFDVTFGVLLVLDTSDITPLRGSATASSGTVLTDAGANFLTGPNAPRLAQVVKNTTDGTQCTIAAVAATTLTCATPTVTWSSGDAYDVDGGLADRFFVKVDSAADQAELSVGDIAVGGTFSLTGKVGFLEVEASGNGAVNSQDESSGFPADTAFGVMRADSSKPVVRIDINAPETFMVDTNGSTAGGEQTLADTIGVVDLLFHLDDAHLDAVCNLKATAGLGISAEVDGTELASGGVSAGWPTVFKAGSCEPNFSTLEVDADGKFNANIKDFDLYPSVSGVHNGGDNQVNLEDTTKDFDGNAVNGGNLLNLTLHNKTTGASCKILTLDGTHLNCTLSGGNRNGITTGNANQWKNGDEYETEGNALALLAIILDHLDELVEQVDQIAPGQTDKEIPLIGISTKELVAKIQSLKQTIDELRGSPLAEIDCSKNPDGSNPAGFNVEVFPDNTTLYCRAVSTIEPATVVWTGKELVGADESDHSPLTVTPGAFLPGPTVSDPPIAGNILETVGPDAAGTPQDDRVAIVVTDNDGTDATTSLDEWQVRAEYTDAAGTHTVEFPSTAPPQTLQDLEKLIGEKLGVPNVLKLDLLDLPAAGAGPITTGAALGTSDTNTLQSSENFTNGTADPVVGNTLFNLEATGGPRHCTITEVATNSLECGAAGIDMDWGDGDDYEIVGDSDATKDLIVRLGFGVCSADDAGTGPDALCKSGDADAPALTVPLNTDLGAAGDLVTLNTEGDLSLDYAVRAQLDVAIPLKLDLTPDVVVLDTTKAEVAGRLTADGVGLDASIGPVEVQLGTAVDLDGAPDSGPGDDGTGIAKLGAELSINKDPDNPVADQDDAVDNNRTFTFGNFFGDLDVTFQGADPDLSCQDSPDVDGDACAVLDVAIAGILVPGGPITVTCTAEPLSCTPILPAGLQALLDGQPLNWGLLLQILPQLLTKLETELDGAAKDVHIPLVGDTLDAGANIVGTFNDEVVTPFANLAAQITASVDASPNGDGDLSPEPWEVAKKVQSFIFDGAGTGFSGLGPAGADLLLDLNASGGPATIDDVVVTPLCTDSYIPCEPGHALTSIKDLRIAFLLGDDLVDADVPFDIGLRGLPIRLSGGVASDVGWSVFVDFGLNKDGPYLRTSGPKSFAGGETGTDGLPSNADAPAADTAITGAENERNEPIVDGGPGPDGDPDTVGDNPPDTFPDHNYLQDDDASFAGKVEPGMWLYNLGTDQGCRIYSVEATILRCDDPSTAADEGITWRQTGATDGDNYAVIELHPPNEEAGGKSELNLSARVGMGENTAVNCTDAQHDYSSLGEPAELNAASFSSTRCLAGELAFLAVTIRDKDAGQDCDDDLSSGEAPTALCLGVRLDLTTGDDRVTVSDLISGDLGLKPSLSGQANIDVRFRTGLNTGQSAGFPSVVGKFHLYWGFAVNTTEGLDFGDLAISFDALNLDAGKFISQFLTPIVKQVKKITGPLMPVVELVQGEIPIISDLSKLVGEGPVTVLDVLEAVSGNDLSLLRSILQFVRFVNTMPGDGNLLIPLGGGAGGGSFGVTGDRAGGAAPMPDEPLIAQGITPAGDTATNLVSNLATQSGTPYGAIDDAPDECAPNRGSTFGVCGLTFPFLGDASQIFGVLMGKDATLVRYDAGTFGAGAGFGFCFPPILIGPVPVQICIGGSFRVEGRFAIGYDTSGLRKVLAGGTGTHLLDGIFLDDYDVNGADVPEVKFIGTVYAEGAVSVYIFKVGIRGEIIFTTELNLHEDDPKDGKLRIEEIISRLANPLCLFDITGRIEAALSAFVEIDLYLVSKRFSIEIVRITLLEFDLDVCSPEPPNLADVRDGPGPGTTDELVLNIGTRATLRNVAEEEPDENFTVRQMESFTSGPNNGKTRFSITAYGIQEDEFLSTPQVNNGEARLYAEAADGDDTISLLPGGNSGTQSQPNQQNPPVPFKLRGVILADTGNDEITTGDGNDDVQGEGGSDRLITGAGADKIRGGNEDDKIDAGEGDDTDVQGGDGNDNINGGKGGDTLQGDAGDDIVSAGPDAATATSVDDLRGESGNDTLTADGGNDKLYGDEILAFDCLVDGSDLHANAGSDNNRDTLIGADGDDQMHGGSEGDQLDGGNGADTMCGGGGPDEMVGAAGTDTEMGGSGDDNIAGGTENDALQGGSGRDYMIGDEGTLTRSGSVVTASLTGSFAGIDTMDGGTGDDFMWGQAGTDAMNGNENDDELRGGLGVDTMSGNADDDEMYGEDANDLMHGNAGNDYMRGGVGIDTMDGDGDTDEMYGDNDADVMRGGDADDLMRGGGGGDEIEGNGNTTSALPLNDAANPLSSLNSDLDLNENPATGAWTQVGGGDGDVIYGDADQDDIVGGSQGASPSADDGDTILGNAAQDVILGDNGDISRPGGSDADGTTTRTVSLTDPNAGGGDYIQGNDENDDVYAGGAGDLVHGDLGDDYVEGNGGADGEPSGDKLPVSSIGLYGDAGQDDLIGGTSQAGVSDGADDLWGGQGEDVIAGDNADIARTGGGTCDGYVCNTFRAGDVVDVVIRSIQIWDVDDQAAGDPAAGNSGGDTIGGQDAHDRLYGQGGDDYIEGGGNDDFAFGNAGVDVINGNDGQDDLVGGTGRTDSATAASAADGRADGADVIQGQADFDAISGDNSRMVRQTQDLDASDDTGLWKANTFNNAVDRLIALMDVGVVGSPADASTSGNDQLLGGAADDIVYGQGGNDGISGGGDQDLLEGNANGSGNAPEPAGAYSGAWPAVAGDVIHGDAGADDAGGGTGRIYRMVAGVETQDPVAGVDGRLDGGDTIFGDGGGDALAGDNTVIERALSGGQWLLDDLHSPDAEDVVRRIMRQRDVATVTDLAPLTNGTSGADTIYGNDGVDVAYGQGGDDQIQGNAGDDHLEGNANDDTITGNEGRDDVIGGTGRTFSNDEATAAAGRIDNPSGDDAASDVLHGGDGLGGVASDDDDVIAGDNATVDRVRGTLETVGAELNRLPFNGAWGEATWDEPSILRVVRLLDVATTANTAPETNGTNGDDTINGEANEDVLFGGGGVDTITGDDADLAGPSAADANPGDDYIEGNGGVDTIRGDLRDDDVAGGGSAANGVLDANRDGRFDDDRSGEMLRDAGDLLLGDSGDGTVGDNDVVAGDNARIQRLLAVGSGDWRLDAQRKDLDAEAGAKLRDVFLFDIEIVGDAEPGNADPGESGADTISGNGGEDILLGQGNGNIANAYGTESGIAGPADCQTATGGPGSGTLAGTEEAPNGDDDGDDLPDLNDPQCRVTAPGDTVLGESGEDYIEGNQGSDNVFGADGEDDVIGGSSANNGHVNAILPPVDRDLGFAPGAIAESNKPFNLLDGHDVVQGNAEDDLVAGDNAFADRYNGAGGAWLTMAGPGGGPYPATDRPNSQPARGPWTVTDMVRRDVTTKASTESAGAFGNDFVQGGTGKDDVYGLLGNDWLEGNEEEDAIVGDMGKIVNNQIGGPTPDTMPDPPLDQFITPPQPFLGATINRNGQLKREVTLYAFTGAQAGIGHDVALGGDANDAIHTGPGEDLANGNAGDDFIYLGDNFTATTAVKGKAQALMAHDRVDAAWGGSGHDHLWGGYGADYLDVRPRSTTTAPGIGPTSDPETWFQVAGAEPSHNSVVYPTQENFEGIDYIYGGWDQDTMQANEGDNGPKPGDRLLDWAGVYNGYYLCPSTYGDWVSTRSAAPGLIEFLQSMSQGGGATTTATAGSSGFRETAIVFQNEHGQNTQPIHPDTPAHFTCGPGVTIP